MTSKEMIAESQHPKLFDIETFDSEPQLPEVLEVKTPLATR